MLVIGGVDSTATSGADTLDEDTFLTPDLNKQGLAIFDMTELEFTSGYNSEAEEYVWSTKVASYYASNTAKTPTTWGSSRLEAVFKTTHFPNATTSSTPTTSSSNTAAASSKSPSNTGAIAGGVIGGIAVLAALAGFLFYLRKRRTRNNVVEKKRLRLHST